MKNLILGDKWQSEGQGDTTSGKGGSDNRCRVSWNARCATVEEIKDALDDQYKRGNGN